MNTTPGRLPEPSLFSCSASYVPAFGEMRKLGAEVVEIGTGGDPFHAPARALYESLGCVHIPVAV
ncbi:hypothetical protein ACIQM3_21460 [Streptomyces sp. NPDC091271]|uniref:hypothetical protein n=1 Tax=Streptomyces sp. NPDC091271 TaxID=3365980 RepID=UPI003822FEFF